ncbi:MAG: DnaJ domain-containing protein [Gemmatimonadaceae bacterium]
MSETPTPDYYEILQLSSRADTETVERVFRHLANRYHPDNQDSGNAEIFTELVNAHNTLADPAKRAAYDVGYERLREARWRIFDQTTATSEISNDSRLRHGILSLLYVARRNNSHEPGVAPMEFERVLSCPDQILQFQLWYLKENGWVERMSSGQYSITAGGVDKLFDLGGPPRSGPYLLHEGEKADKVAS